LRFFATKLTTVVVTASIATRQRPPHADVTLLSARGTSKTHDSCACAPKVCFGSKPSNIQEVPLPPNEPASNESSDTPPLIAAERLSAGRLSLSAWRPNLMVSAIPDGKSNSVIARHIRLESIRRPDGQRSLVPYEIRESRGDGIDISDAHQARPYSGR